MKTFKEHKAGALAKKISGNLDKFAKEDSKETKAHEAGESKEKEAKEETKVDLTKLAENLAERRKNAQK